MNTKKIKKLRKEIARLSEELFNHSQLAIDDEDEFNPELFAGDDYEIYMDLEDEIKEIEDNNE